MHARSQGHTIAEAIGFGAPVFAAGGRVVGCVGIPIPILRFREEDALRLAQAVTETAAAISAEFGGEGAPSRMRS